MLSSGVKLWLPPILLPYAKAVSRSVSQLDPPQRELRKTFQSLNAKAGANEMILRGNLRLVVHPDSRIPFEYFCWRSAEMTQELDAFLSLSNGAERLLDVGALHGIFSLAFAQRRQSRSVVAVDPSPLAFAKLLYNVHANKLTQQIHTVECALSDTEGELLMFYEWEHAVAAPLKPETAGTMFQRMTGESLCEQLGFIPDVVKIDVEGHEVKVIRGLAKIIHQAKPMLFLEIHPQRIEREHDSLEKVLVWLQGEGYHAQDISSRAQDMRELWESRLDTRAILSVKS
jgi:FkbM family methyltransferase